MSKRQSFPLIALFLVGSCSSEATEPKLGGVGADDARALDEAAETLDTENQAFGTENER